jgi:hypothetical protein
MARNPRSSRILPSPYQGLRAEKQPMAVATPKLGREHTTFWKCMVAITPQIQPARQCTNANTSTCDLVQSSPT